MSALALAAGIFMVTGPEVLAAQTAYMHYIYSTGGRAGAIRLAGGLTANFADGGDTHFSVDGSLALTDQTSIRLGVGYLTPDRGDGEITLNVLFAQEFWNPEDSPWSAQVQGGFGRVGFESFSLLTAPISVPVKYQFNRRLTAFGALAFELHRISSDQGSNTDNTVAAFGGAAYKLAPGVKLTGSITREFEDPGENVFSFGLRVATNRTPRAEGGG